MRERRFRTDLGGGLVILNLARSLREDSSSIGRRRRSLGRKRKDGAMKICTRQSEMGIEEVWPMMRSGRQRLREDIGDSGAAVQLTIALVPFTTASAPGSSF